MHPPERGKIKGSLKFRDDALVVEDNQNKKILILYSGKTTTTKKTHQTTNHDTTTHITLQRSNCLIALSYAVTDSEDSLSLSSTSCKTLDTASTSNSD